MTNPLYDTLLGHRADSPAPLLHLPQGEVVSYADMAAQVAQISGYLRAAGLKKGDRLAMQCPKSPAALALYLACLHSGLIFLPLNTAYTPDEIAYFVGDATPKIIVVDPDAHEALLPTTAKNGTKVLTLDAQGRGSFTSAMTKATPARTPVACSTDDLACFLYTSGTTGRSKGAMLTQGNLLSNADTLTTCWRFTDKDVLARIIHQAA